MIQSEGLGTELRLARKSGEVFLRTLQLNARSECKQYAVPVLKLAQFAFRY